MSYAPAPLAELMAYWVKQGGVNLGIVGDLAHQKRASYHNGQDAIDKYGRTASTDYSIRLPRDREPYLTNAAAGTDFGKLDGSLRKLYDFSIWLVEQCKAKAPGTEDIREVIFSPDGKKVQRWDNYGRRLYDGWPVATGQGDSSHLWHTHVSWFRDSEKRSKVKVISPYFEETDMGIDWYPISRPTGPVEMQAGRGLVNLVTGRYTISTDLIKTSQGGVHLVEPWSAGTGMQEGYLVRHAQQAHVMLDGTVAKHPEKPTTEPGDCAAEQEEATQTERARAQAIRDEAVAKLADI